MPRKYNRKTKQWIKTPKAKKAIKALSFKAPFKLTASKYKEAKNAVYRSKGGNMT